MKKVEEKKKLESAFSLWEQTSKKENVYYTGKDCNNKELVAFINDDKKNVKEPDLRIYEKDDKGDATKEVCSLWYTTSKNNHEYLTGKTSDNEKIIAFINEDADEDNNQPYIRAYFKD